MKTVSLYAVGIAILLPFFVSCTTLRSGTPVKAAVSLDDPDLKADDFNVPAGSGFPSEKPSWTARYIPGWKWLADTIPPPTEARTKWDERYNRRRGLGSGGFSENSL